MKYSIAELRRKAVIELAERKNKNPNEQDLKDAARAMNSYYKLCGLDEHLLYLQNDERTCNSRYTHEQEEKAQRWVKRLIGYLEPYNATIVYFGYLPTIVEIGTTRDLYLAYHY